MIYEEGSSVAHCSCDPTQPMKDTACGMSSLLNLCYLFILVMTFSSLVLHFVYFVCFFSKHNIYFKEWLFLTLIVSVYGQLNLLFKCLDIYINYNDTIYHFFQNQQFCVNSAVGIYISIWMLTYLHTLSQSAKCQKKTVAIIAILLLVLIPLFFMTSLVFVFVSNDYGATNFLEYFSVGFRFFILISYFIIGYLLTTQVIQLPQDRYRLSVQEERFKIILCCVLQIVPFLQDLSELILHTRMHDYQFKLCYKQDMTWPLFVLSFQFFDQALPFGFIIYLILTVSQPISLSISAQQSSIY